MTKEEEREALKIILGEAFDGVTEKITERDTERDTGEKHATTEESSATPTIGHEADFVTKRNPTNQ